MPGMTYASVNGLQLYYETRGSGRPLVLLHGGLMTIDLNFGPLLEPLAATRQVIAVELQGHGHTADTDRAMTIEGLAGDVVALLGHLRIAEADLFGFSLGGLVACAVALGWDGVKIEEVPLRFEMRDGWLHEWIDENGKSTKVVTQVDAEQTAGPAEHLLDLGRVIEIEVSGEPEPVTQRTR